MFSFYNKGWQNDNYVEHENSIGKAAEIACLWSKGDELLGKETTTT